MGSQRQEVIEVTVANFGEVRDRQQLLPHYLNGLYQLPGPSIRMAELLDSIIFVTPESIVDRIGQLAAADAADAVDAQPQPEEPAPQPEIAPPPSDEYLVVACFNNKHQRVNDVLAHDPKCEWCHGLGIVRIRRDHVPIVRPTGKGKQTWSPVNDIVDQIGDLGA